MKYDYWMGQAERPVMHVKNLLRGFVDLHKMTAKDAADCFHTHPYYAVRIILFGGYVEELEDGRHRTWIAGMIGLVTPSYCHRIAGLRNGRVSYSLWIKGPKRWKIELRGKGWNTNKDADHEPSIGTKT